MPTTPWSQESYLNAIWFAANAHNKEDQKIPGTDIPYVVHLTQVTMEVMGALANEIHGDGDLAIQCALLHDAIEDTHVTFEEIESTFGRPVAEGVLALTKDETLPGGKPAWMRDSLQRIKEQPHSVWIVKLADRITNLQSPPHYWKPEKIQRYYEEAHLIYQTLKDASPYLAERMRQKLDVYQQHLPS